jgi:predicted RNA methylase
MSKIKHMSTQSEMKVISILLDEAMQYGLEVEIIYHALKLMREDDAITPSQAMQEAMNEFIK